MRPQSSDRDRQSPNDRPPIPETTPVTFSCPFGGAADVVGHGGGERGVIEKALVHDQVRSHLFAIVTLPSVSTQGVPSRGTKPPTNGKILFTSGGARQTPGLAEGWDHQAGQPAGHPHPRPDITDRAQVRAVFGEAFPDMAENGPSR